MRLGGEDIRHGRVPDAVAVRLLFGRETRVECGLHLFGRGQADVGRKEVVRSEHQPAAFDGERYVRMGALPARVNAGVGAPGALDADGGAEDPRKRCLDDGLDARRIDLRLPSEVTRAEVLEGEEVTHGEG